MFKRFWTYEKYHNVSYGEIKTGRSDARKYENSIKVLVVVKLLDVFVSFLECSLPINCKA